ncbi:unnamed protein product, partial [Meganyctiphanes norvegica]
SPIRGSNGGGPRFGLDTVTPRLAHNLGSQDKMENRIEDAEGIETAMSAKNNLSDLPNIDDCNKDNISSSQNIPTNSLVTINSEFPAESTISYQGQDSTKRNLHEQNSHDSLYTENIKPESISSDLISKRNFPADLDPVPKGLNKRCDSMDSLLSVESLNDPQQDTESESHSDANQLINGREGKLHDLPVVKRSKRQKTKSPKDSNGKQLVKKKTGTKTQIKSKFATGSVEYIQQNLGGQIFSGWIEERKWIDSIGGYRDVVQVDEWEIEINRHIKAITTSIPGVTEGTKWINVTGPSEKEPCCCLWVLMPAPPTPGHYWFQVANITVEPLFGLRIFLRMIRNIHAHDGETKEARQRRRELLTKNTPEAVVEGFGQQVELWVDKIRSTDLKAVLATVGKTLTFHNIKETIRFTIVLLVTIVVGLVHFGKEAWFFSVRFMHEAGVFMRNVTPFFQSLLRFVEKLIGGFYVLVAMVYRDIRHGPPPSSFPPNRPPAAYLSGPGGPPQLALPPGTQPQYMSANMGQQQSVPRYVPADNWVYKRQNTADATETS